MYHIAVLSEYWFTFPGWADKVFSSLTQSPNDRPGALVVPFKLQWQATIEDRKKH